MIKSNYSLENKDKEIETYLYPADTIKALKEFGYSVERSIDNQSLVTWYKD